jgi:hypothetical protein
MLQSLTQSMNASPVSLHTWSLVMNEEYNGSTVGWWSQIHAWIHVQVGFLFAVDCRTVPVPKRSSSRIADSSYIIPVETPVEFQKSSPAGQHGFYS